MRKRDWFLAGIGLLIVSVILGKCDNSSRKKGDAVAEQLARCEGAIRQGMQLLAKGDLAGARVQNENAGNTCTSKSRNEMDKLQAAISKAENAGSACTRTFGNISDQLDAGQLSAASAALDKLNKRCVNEATAKKLRQRLAAAQSTETKASTAVRDEPVSTPAPVPAPAATAPAVVKPVVQAPAPAPAPVAKTELHTAKVEMAAGFIQDAEVALSQSRFDAARTYLDSARRMDPHNSRLDGLARQIRERERQLMQQETVIK